MATRCCSLPVCFVLLVIALGLVVAPTAWAIQVTVTIESLAPVNGTFLTPVWVGFHDGTFDSHDLGSPTSIALERLAEDGTTGDIAAAFAGSGAGAVEGTIPGPTGPIAPGQTASLTFALDGTLPASRFFSYASMVIPSNDAFIANGNPLAFQIFDLGGNFLGADFIVAGSAVLDAGTEVNDEVPANTAFFGQTTPNTGVTENGVVVIHPGFQPPGNGGILADPVFANADFKALGYLVARITVTQAVPEPATVTLLGIGLLVLALRKRRPG